MASALLDLSKQDSLLTVTVSALVVHWVFNRWEPLHLGVVSTLLVVIPTALSALLAPYYGAFYALTLTFALYHATLLTSIALYRLSPFHPYAQFPGPIPAKLSMFWVGSIATGGKKYEYISQLHEQYGDYVRVGPDEVSIRDPAAIQPVMGVHGLPKGPMWTGVNFHNPNPALISLSDTSLHQTRRKPWNRAFSTLATKEYQPIIIRRAVQLVDRLAEHKGATIDLAQWFGFFAYDFMSDIVFGGGTEMLRDGDSEGLWQSLKDALVMQTIYEHVPWLAYYARHLPFVAQDTKKFRKFCMERGTNRYRQGSKEKDLFYYLSNEDGAEKVNPPPPVVIGNSALAVIAGSDTTSTTLSNLFVSVLRQPHYYKRLQEEVDRYYPPGDDATNPQHHSKMVFMEACISEALRLYPVVPSGSQRGTTSASGGKAIGHHYIPPGHQVRIHYWSVHRDPRNFTHATSYFPERWLIAEGLESMPSGEPFVHNRNAYVPFSFGPANCVGKNMALLEMRIVICHLMQRLNLRLADKWDPAEWEQNITERLTTMIGGLPVVVTPRP